MSLINNMLRELDKRNAPQSGTAGSLAQNLRPVRSQRRFSDLFWYVMAVLMCAAVGWIGWVIWQLTPRSVVTELAFASTAAAKKRDGVPIAAATPAVAVPISASQNSASSQIRVDMLRLATELTTPIPPERKSETPARRRSASANSSANSAKPAKPKAASSRTETKVAGSGTISRSASLPKERAEDQYRLAVGLINRGRIAEGMEGLRAALKTDPGHEAARQTLVALLLESKRYDDAAAVLRDGLADQPKNTGFVVLLARIAVERNDIPGALALLQAHAADATENGDYHAFVGALHQRLGKHQEAIEEYRIALRLAPAAGVWWVGLGISSQAANQPKEAIEAFQRAKASGNLAPDLLVFVDQRLKQLQ